MAGSLNKVMLIGHLGADPESRKTGNGDPVVNMRVATSESWKDQRSGERKEKTEWHTVTIWNEATAGFIGQYAQKGDKVYVEGTLQTRKWEDNNGVEKFTTEVVVPKFGGKVELLTQKDGGGSRDNDNDDRGGGRGRGSSRGRDDDRGGDDRGSSRGRGRGRDRDDDRGGDDRGGSRGRGRDDDRGADRDDDRGSNGRRTRGAEPSRNKLDDEIPF